ncbi:hypothetical protein BH20VER1_BH20VER1_25600 [soil metagenome]
MAAFRGSVEFTAAEKAAHQQHVSTIAPTARRYLEDIFADHLAFHRRHGVSKYYGDRSTLLNTRAKRIAALQQAGAPVSLVDQLQPTSCIGLSLNALVAGFRAPGDANLESALAKVQQFARANDLDGCSVIHALQKLGWACISGTLPRNRTPAGRRREELAQQRLARLPLQHRQQSRELLLQHRR